MGLFVKKTKNIKLAFLIPNEVVLRSQMLCGYISKEVGYTYTIYKFVQLLYECFIEEAMQVYNPKGIIDILEDDTITIKQGTEVYKANRDTKNTQLMEITMIKVDADKGLLVLSELKELSGYKSSLGNLVAKVWINFIERYKKADNNEMLNNIVEMLKM